jgi:hypothetical protein
LASDVETMTSLSTLVRITLERFLDSDIRTLLQTLYSPAFARDAPPNLCICEINYVNHFFELWRRSLRDKQIEDSTSHEGAVSGRSKAPPFATGMIADPECLCSAIFDKIATFLFFLFFEQKCTFFARVRGVWRGKVTVPTSWLIFKKIADSDTEFAPGRGNTQAGSVTSSRVH